jgi:hypothetical protein
MTDPQTELSTYLENLIFRCLHIDSLNRQVNQILEWETPERIEALDMGSHFFELSLYTFSRTVLLDIYKLVSDGEDKSLIDWLNKAREHCSKLDVSIFDPEATSGNRRRKLSNDEYIQIIDSHLDLIKEHSTTIQNLKGRRDKVIAHTDRTFFNDPRKMLDRFPLTDIDIDSLLDSIKKILHDHYSFLFHAHLSMEVSALTDVESILRNARAFRRVWKDKRITRECKIRVADYLQDEYKQT